MNKNFLHFGRQEKPNDRIVEFEKEEVARFYAIQSVERNVKFFEFS
jgi:hypothetical protein